MVQIHPFPNGNGRHARITADIYLQQCFGATPIDWAAGHNLQSMNDRRTQYIAALRSADAGDFALLLSFVGV
jgi:fido (protein-threonine AMPylation protein)